MAANSKQVAGTHYGGGTYQHWDMVVEHKLNYFQGQITKYVMRAPKKNGKQDLEKAQHFLEKYLEVYDQLHPPVEASLKPVGVGVLKDPWKPIPTPEAYDYVRNVADERVQRQYADAQFSIEGHNAQGQALYKCKGCGAENWAMTNHEAHLTHGSCAGRGYVSQG